MGSPPGEAGRSDAEGPQHQVTIEAPFALGRFAVTLQEFSAFVEAEAHAMPDEMYTFEQEKWEVRKGRSFRNPGFLQTARHPVVGVNWDDAVAYCKWLSKATGKDYRLASEAEWEYACRARTQTAYSFGNEAKMLDDYAWHWGNSGKRTHPVGEKKANDFGLYDMHGNVWEWCADSWHENYRGAPEDGSVWQGGDASLRVLRGGSWYDIPRDLRAAYRNGYTTDYRYDNLGFRLARTLTP